MKLKKELLVYMKNKKRILITFSFLLLLSIIFYSFIIRPVTSSLSNLPKKDETINVNEVKIYKTGDSIVGNSVYFSGFLKDSISIGVTTENGRRSVTTQLYFPLLKNQVIETDIINAPFSFTEKFELIDFNVENGKLKLKRVE